LSGYGDISSERVYGRTETLTCVLKDKTILETKIKGYISGEDGKNGMRGRLVSKQGQLIAYSLLSGLAGGVGQGLAESVTSLNTNPLGSTQTVDPDKVFEYGAYRGTGTALDRISRWYLERADETYPIIEAAAGRTVEIVITEGVYLDEGQIERGRRPIITDEERRKAATVESTPWSERGSQ
jgi:conjugal transfer pilus assembly protein TraB